MLRDLIPSMRRPVARVPNDPFVSIRRAMDRLYDDFLTDVGYSGIDLLPDGVHSFSPRIDIEEKDDVIVLSAELPGLTEKDVQVEADAENLIIRGEKKSQREEKHANYSCTERAFGTFERVLRMPGKIDKDGIRAGMKEGVLTVTIPRPPEARKEMRKIPVTH
jgi:HSP20 family protein